MIPLQRLLVAFMGFAKGLVHAGPVKLEDSDGTYLEKREVCYLDTYGNPYTCTANYNCCVGTYVSSCIPSGNICCDMGSLIGWCPIGSTCGTSNGVPACLGSGGNTVSPATATNVQTSSPQTSAPEPTSNSSSSGSLSKSAVIGIAVSVTCSVLGLIIGVWIKYHFSKKELVKKQVGQR